MSTWRAEAVTDDADLIGEGPAWDARDERLLWVDIAGATIHEATAGEEGWSLSAERHFDAAVGAVVPHRDGGLLAMVGTDFVHLRDGADPVVVASIGGDDRRRFNDAKCDPRGRLLAGWMDERADGSMAGELWRVDPDGAVTPLLDDVGLSNGLDWSPDGETFYFIDTLTRGVDAFDYDLDRGTLSNRRRLVTFDGSDGIPDGMCVDDEGCLWVAVLLGGQVRRYSPAGSQIGVVEVAAPQVTSCAFGGAGRDLLFITSLSVQLPDEVADGFGVSHDLAAAAARSDHNGRLFVCRPGVTGPAATPFG